MKNKIKFKSKIKKLILKSNNNKIENFVFKS